MTEEKKYYRSSDEKMRSEYLREPDKAKLDQKIKRWVRTK